MTTMAKMILIVTVAASLGLAACGGDDDDAGDAAPSTASEQPSGSAAGADMEAGDGGQQGSGGSGNRAGAGGEGEASGIEITTAGSQYGEILFDADERAIYLFDKESGPTSECYGECAAAWPPVLTEGKPRAGGAVDTKLLGTTERDDGTTQVTYAGRPLYYYVDDPPGQVLCHNVEEFGGLWLVVEPSGQPVQ